MIYSNWNLTLILLVFKSIFKILVKYSEHAIAEEQQLKILPLKHTLLFQCYLWGLQTGREHNMLLSSNGRYSVKKVASNQTSQSNLHHTDNQNIPVPVVLEWNSVMLVVYVRVCFSLESSCFYNTVYCILLLSPIQAFSLCLIFWVVYVLYMFN
jgi:hypothetical protein